MHNVPAVASRRAVLQRVAAAVAAVAPLAHLHLPSRPVLCARWWRFSC
ncbi:twin-arginine translocation signal domain-containing protein [Serratia liquefaciens]